ncbi:MAG: PAS domain-containing protein [Cognaticolwellia sp.]|jgi:PAS domain-containing protein
MYRLYNVDKSNVEDLQQAWFSKIYINDQRCVDGEIQAAIKNNRKFCLEFRVFWPEKSVHYIKAISKTSFDHGGRALQIVGVNYDITE